MHDFFFPKQFWVTNTACEASQTVGQVQRFVGRHGGGVWCFAIATSSLNPVRCPSGNLLRKRCQGHKLGEEVECNSHFGASELVHVGYLLWRISAFLVGIPQTCPWHKDARGMSDMTT